MSIASRIGRVVLLAASIGFMGGCFGFGVPSGQQSGQDAGLPPGGNGTPPGNDGTDLAVNLRLSNTTPRPGETVTLTCSLVRDEGANVTFAFQPDFGRLVVDGGQGTAILIVDESDVGVALSFTCTASDENGAGAPSDPQTITVSP